MLHYFIPLIHGLFKTSLSFPDIPPEHPDKIKLRNSAANIILFIINTKNKIIF